MITNWLQLGILLALLLLMVRPLGTYMAHVYRGDRTELAGWMATARAAKEAGNFIYSASASAISENRTWAACAPGWRSRSRPSTRNP